ncbi:hypothetical protein [Novosphingobium aquae]|uniref:Uncharacterized protein n=1 Tax=Novosphingobium aquae TaxID=3133435 RepID=A0ABU8SC31_9SPHN
MILEAAKALQQCRVGFVPHAALEVVPLFAVIVAGPIDGFGFSQIPIDAQSHTKRCMKVAKQGILQEIMRIAQVSFLHLRPIKPLYLKIQG